MMLADLVAHVLYDTFEWGRCPTSSIGRSFGDLQVEETWQRQIGRERMWCVRGRLAEYYSLGQEKGGDNYPMVPVRAHGGRWRSSGKQSGPSKSCDDVIT